MHRASDPRELTQHSASELAAGVRDGVWTAKQVVEAHIARYEVVNPQLNALVVPLFDRARREAAEVDASRARGEPLGLLAGVPVTIKECFDVAGTPATLGLPSRAKLTASEDAPLVKQLRRAGAVILGKTNVPQLMLLHETDNPLYGRTLHPLDPQRSPGGSSGGEAAIVAAHASALGLASDLGGSIRQPAHACGICGFKPTTQRLPNRGINNVFSGLEALGGQPGPIARSVDDLALAMQVLCDTDHPVDVMTPPLAWHPTTVEPTQLRMGVWLDETPEFVRSSPAIRRAVNETAAALQSTGVTVEPFELPDLGEAMRLYFRLISANGGRAAVKVVGNDPRMPAVSRLLRLGRLPRWSRPLIGSILHLLGQDGAAWLVRNTGKVSTGDFWRMTFLVRLYQRKVVDLLLKRGLSGFIGPPHALAALTHGSSGYLSLAAKASMLINLLGLPAGVVPWTTVRPGEESDRRASRDWVERAALAVEAGSAGLPIGVQVVGLPWRDEETLAIMRLVENLRPMKPKQV